MAQKLFTTFRAAVESFPLGEQNIGLIKPGRYNGYDIFNKTGGLTFRLSHSGSISKTKKDGTPDNQFGAIIMPTGIVIHESDTIDLLVTNNSGNTNAREDLVICEHDYQEVQNGTPANYSVVKGPMDGSKPTLPNPEKQVIVGRITITPGGYTEDDISYKKETANLPGDLTYNELLQLLNESLNISDATETVKGIARLATNAEAQAGTDDKTIVTPKSLSIVTSTETRKGLTRKSTDAEVLAGTNNDAYVTPKQIMGNLPILNSKKSPLNSNITLSANDNGKIFISTSTTATQLIIDVPNGLPENFHVGAIWGTCSIKLQGVGATLLYDATKLPESKSANTAMLLESTGNNDNKFFVLGNLKNV